MAIQPGDEAARIRVLAESRIEVAPTHFRRIGRDSSVLGLHLAYQQGDVGVDVVGSIDEVDPDTRRHLDHVRQSRQVHGHARRVVDRAKSAPQQALGKVHGP